MTNLLDLITPTNLESEKVKFFASSSYNPTFHYIWQDQEQDPSFSISLKNELWQAIKAQEQNAIVEAASTLFEVTIDKEILGRAQIIASEKGELSGGSLADVTQAFENVLDAFDLDYTIKIVSDSGFNIRPNHAGKEIIISDKIHFEYFSVQAEVHHELVHIIRHMNGKYNHIKRSQNFLPTEEGLASWCQDYTNDDLSQVQHAIEYIASSVGISGSLRDIYDCMTGLGMSRELAWKRAIRHKFGFVDTSLAGDILKPAMYYANSEKIGKLSVDEKLRLFVGKISLSDLRDHPTYTGRWGTQKLIKFFKL